MHISVSVYIYICKLGYYSTKWKRDNPFATTWMNLEDVMCGEISQTQKDKYCIIAHVCEI